MRLSETIEDKIICITDTESGAVTKLEPKAIENCMKPGTFIIKPIEKWENDTVVEYRIGDVNILLDKKAMQKGTVMVSESPFEPRAEYNRPSCNPCRNCGRC